MTPHWLAHARASARARSTHPAKHAHYLHLEFTSVTDPITVEVSEGVEVEFEITGFRIGDDGVGSFEYHGFKGNHSRPFVEVTEVTPITINGKMIDGATSRELQDDFQRGLITAECEEIPE